jgi:hypothetical protein
VSHSEGWTISGAPLDLHKHGSLLAMAAGNISLNSQADLQPLQCDHAETFPEGALEEKPCLHIFNKG